MRTRQAGSFVRLHSPCRGADLYVTAASVVLSLRGAGRCWPALVRPSPCRGSAHGKSDRIPGATARSFLIYRDYGGGFTGEKGLRPAREAGQAVERPAPPEEGSEALSSG